MVKGSKELDQVKETDQHKNGPYNTKENRNVPQKTADTVLPCVSHTFTQCIEGIVQNWQS